MGLHIVATLRHVFPGPFEWRPTHFDRLIGSAKARVQLDDDQHAATTLKEWPDAEAEFRIRRRPYLLYD
jgi:hypothetical protein